MKHLVVLPDCCFWAEDFYTAARREDTGSRVTLNNGPFSILNTASTVEQVFHAVATAASRSES